MKNFFLITFLFLAISSNAQKTFEDRDMTWLGYFNQLRFTNKSGAWIDLHWRLNNDFIKETHATLLRGGYTYYINDKTRVTLGYAFQKQYGHDGAPSVLEHRPWQQIQWTEKKKWFNMMQWIRLEQRYRKAGDADYSFLSHRIRYNLALTVPLTRKEVAPKTLFLFTNNEVFINVGEKIVYNYFDQNRFFLGLGYQFTSHLNAQLGYMNVFQQTSAGNSYIRTDAIRLFVFHHLDFRKEASH